MERESRRLPALDPADWSDSVRGLLGHTLDRVEALEGGESRRSGPLNILRTMAHHEGVLGPFLGFASALALHGVLPRRASELLALRAAWNCRSPFEWGHHVIYARAAGLRDEEIDAIPDGPDAGSWSEVDRALLRAADELHRDSQVCDATFAELRAHWSDAQLVEIPFIVGNYTMLSMIANMLDVPLEPGHPELPSR